MTTYLDFAASAPTRPAALAAFVAASEVVGNAASVHASGREVRRVVEESREALAADFNVLPTSVVVCSGGTEADNLGVKGLFWQRREEDPARDIIVISGIEHPAVLEAAQWLADHEGANLVEIPTLSSGVINIDWLDDFVRASPDRIALAAVMWANNETGVVQPIEDVLGLLEPFAIPLHCDAAQATAWREVPATWSASPMTIAISGHKLGAPTGVGALIATKTTVKPTTHGGGQEFGLRSGTVPAALAASLAAALSATRDDGGQARTVAALRESLIHGIAKLDLGAVVNGSPDTDVLPGIVSVTFPGCPADAMLMLLDARGICCSAGSACGAGVPRPSRVLMAMGLDEAAASQTLRFSLGWTSTRSDVEVLLAELPAAVERARRTTSAREVVA